MPIINGTNFRAGPDGVICAPARGEPPPCPNGFEPTDDPFVFALALEPCEYRDKILVDD